MKLHSLHISINPGTKKSTHPSRIFVRHAHNRYHWKWFPLFLFLTECKNRRFPILTWPRTHSIIKITKANIKGVYSQKVPTSHCVIHINFEFMNFMAWSVTKKYYGCSTSKTGRFFYVFCDNLSWKSNRQTFLDPSNHTYMHWVTWNYVHFMCFWAPSNQKFIKGKLEMQMQKVQYMLLFQPITVQVLCFYMDFALASQIYFFCTEICKR